MTICIDVSETVNWGSANKYFDSQQLMLVCDGDYFCVFLRPKTLTMLGVLSLRSWSVRMPTREIASEPKWRWKKLVCWHFLLLTAYSFSFHDFLHISSCLRISLYAVKLLFFIFCSVLFCTAEWCFMHTSTEVLSESPWVCCCEWVCDVRF